MDNKIIENFYDDFALKVLFRDLSRINLRQAMAIKTCRTYLRKADSVLEVGCGIGIVSRSLSKHVARHVALDISQENIDIAKIVCEGCNVNFYHLNILDDESFSRIRSMGPFSKIVLIDVIEHIPFAQHKELFDRLARVLSQDGDVIMTYPSPSYQSWLRDNQPSGLQVIDESIELNSLIHDSGMKVRFFKTCDVFKRGQYNHIVLSAKDPFVAERPVIQFKILSRLKFKVLNYLWRMKNRRIISKIGIAKSIQKKTVSS